MNNEEIKRYFENNPPPKEVVWTGMGEDYRYFAVSALFFFNMKNIHIQEALLPAYFS